jgi:choline-sulfatase
MRNSPQSNLQSYLSLTHFLPAVYWLLAPLLLSQTPADLKVNLVSIVTDDQALWSVGAYGNRESITPNMDRLAREGVKFNNAFVTTPVCSPSRAAFLTGLYGSQVGITDFLTTDEAASGMGLPASALTWPRVLQQNGYRTALFGKYHLGHAARLSPDEARLRLLHGHAGRRVCHVESAS